MTSYFPWNNSDENMYGFIDEVIKVVDSIGVTPREKVELAAYQ